MASSSSSRVRKYDVFLSFRGEDTRKNIVSHLHKEFVNRGIVTFKDDKRLEIGHSIPGEIFSAIQDSRFAVVVLSNNYALSRWCLDELQMIMELHRKKEIKVVPIFYGVDPSHVRNQTGMSFTFEKYQSSELAEKVMNWREALTQIATVAGKDSAICEDEASMIEEIVQGISNQLLIMQPVDFSDIVGMDVHMERLNPLLRIESEEVRMIGIWGMGGIGKTTIAKCLFDQFSRGFPARCFFENVCKTCRKHGVSNLRKKFLSTILGLCEKNTSVELGPQEIKARLGHRKVFVVLDNVDDVKQMHALAKESSWFGPGSRIIITTRDKGLLNSCGVGTVYEVKCLDTDDSLQILNQLAFEAGLPPCDLYEKLSIRASWLAQGLPAAIEAYGLFLRKMTSLKEWEDALCRLERAPHTNVMEILKMSYDGLEEADKSVFLHVACLFNGEPLRRATTLLKGDRLHGCLGVRFLAEKSLIEITAGGFIKMHYLVEQTAREIVRRDSMAMPWGRSVLWDPCEVYELLKRKEGHEAMRCMALHMCEMPDALHLDRYNRVFYYNLAYLKVYKHSNHMKSMLHVSSNDTKLLSQRLKLLHWDAFPLTSFPSRFRPWDLVEVSLQCSNLTSFWQEPVELRDLRRLDLSGSKNLELLPDLSKAVNLEELITQGCKRMKRIPESISKLTRLTKLDVSYCDELKSYHITIKEMTRRCRQIALYFSGKEVEMKSIENLSIGGNIHVQMLLLHGNADHLCFTTEQQLPDELTNRKQQQAVKAIPEFHGNNWMMNWNQQDHNKPALDFSMRTPQKVQAVSEFHGHESTKSPHQKARPMSESYGFDSVDIMRFNYNSDGASFLCNGLSMFPCLKELNLINLNIKVIPDDICVLQFLEKLDLSGNDFETLPETMNKLPRLKYASLGNCCRLKALPELVQLETIKLSGCMNLQSLLEVSHAGQDDWGRFRWLELWVESCNKIQSISDQLTHFTKLSYLDLSSHDFESLPSSIRDLSSLGTLCLNKCKKLKSVQGVPLCLKYLYAHGCEILETVSLPLNHSVKHLDLSHCFLLNQHEDLISQFLCKGLNEEDSPRFACFPGNEVPNYLGNPETRKPIPSGSPRILGFEACIMIACQRDFHMQFSPFSYNWSWKVDRVFHSSKVFRLKLKPDFFHLQETSFHTTEEEEEEETVKSDHLVIFRASKTLGEQVDKIRFKSHLQFSEEFQSPPAELKSCVARLILEGDKTDNINLGNKTSPLFFSSKLNNPSEFL